MLLGVRISPHYNTAVGVTFGRLWEDCGIGRRCLESFAYIEINFTPILRNIISYWCLSLRSCWRFNVRQPAIKNLISYCRLTLLLPLTRWTTIAVLAVIRHSFKRAKILKWMLSSSPYWHLFITGRRHPTNTIWGGEGAFSLRTSSFRTACCLSKSTSNESIFEKSM